MNSSSQRQEKFSRFRKIASAIKSIGSYLFAPYHLPGFLYEKLNKSEYKSTFPYRTLLGLWPLMGILTATPHVFITYRLLENIEINANYKLLFGALAVTFPFITNAISDENVLKRISKEDDLISPLEIKLSTEESNKEPTFSVGNLTRTISAKKGYGSLPVTHEAIIGNRWKLESPYIKEVIENPEKFFEELE